ncbi:hypothetical protein BU23DRAFT_574517 [Bimuria novae-zelandiae CBS 107.79]|uniref:Uncharacterized protein n=1 Tax=Bimuria novae-zelandiae CBS 107.79 TaxID=1447943 RepID=A0A6A5USI5_9PLEO|nr:hypothetical protein BU23DRAFT_574517 [Bimuria novae-zelandiae CBS 107.79]
MSAQHQNLAQVWEHLQGRHDVANLVREIIGQHSIDSSLQENEFRSIEESVRTIGWIKIIFDSQRCYLSGIATGVAECPPYVLSCLLPPDLLLSTILYLINVKTRLFSSQTTLMTREFTRPRHILAQTILSGLRLLLLRKDGLETNDIRRLQNAINQAWRDDRLLGVERFIVAELFAEILNALNEPSRENPYQREWTNAKLPTYAAGLYPLDIRVETFVTPLIHGTMEEDWMDAYWVLHDCLWAVECAVTQRFVDLHRQTGVLGSNQTSVDTDEILEQLLHTRTSLVISIFHVTGPMQPTLALLDSLAMTLLDWDADLDSFLSRQDSLLQQRTAPMRAGPNRVQNYGKLVSELSPYFEAALTSFADWLSNRSSDYEQFSTKRAGVTSIHLQEMVKDWVTKMAAPNAETLSRDGEAVALPVYIVNCPKLHAIPKKILELKLRWCDRFAFEAVQGDSPIVSWKEGIPCPSCTGGEKIKNARLIEPFQLLATALENVHVDIYSLSRYSVGESGSFDAASTSHSTSDAGSIVPSLTSNSALSVSQPSHASRPSDPDIKIQLPMQPPRYTESPVSPTTYDPISSRPFPLDSAFDSPVSPLNESLNVPIALPIASRLSVDLPIPVRTPSFDEHIPDAESASMPSELSSGRDAFTPASSIKSTPSFGKMKSSSRTIRIGSSFRRKSSSTKQRDSQPPLPKEPCFQFSSAGHSILLWEKGTNHLIRLDVPSNDASAIQGCRYEVAGIEAAAAGNHKCAIVAAAGSLPRRLVIFKGINVTSESEIDLDLSGRPGEICLAVSRNDKFVAVSLNDEILLYGLDNGAIKKLAFYHQINVYEIRGGTTHKRTISVGRTTSDDTVVTLNDFGRSEPGWFGGQGRGLSSREKAEEQQRQTAIISRKIYFSTDSKRLVVATQLGDHCIYVDVWDCTTEPVTTIAEHSRSFKMPPWTLNDGDLTTVFYDSTHRSALVTAFLGKEYPLHVPFPGYDDLQNETYSTKIVHAAQSPTGETFTVVNAMTEIIQFEYTTKGMLSPRKLKKASSKISQGVFKPGAIALAMPLENVLQIFWVKDGKCMLRIVKIGAVEQFNDYDLRPHYDRLMSLKTKPVIARAPSLMIPELDAT